MIGKRYKLTPVPTPYPPTAMGYKDLSLSFFPSTSFEDHPDLIPLDSILALARNGEVPSVVVYVPKTAPSTCPFSYSPVPQQGVQVDVFLQYSRMQFAAYGNTSNPLLVTLGEGGVVITGSEAGERRSLAMYGPSDEEEALETPPFRGSSVTIMLVEPDVEAGTSYAVFSDVIKTLMSSMSGIGLSPTLLRCPVFSQGECSKENLHRRAEGGLKIIVIAPHLLSRVTFQHNDVPVVLADPTILPEGTILYNFEHVKRGAGGGQGGQHEQGLLDGDILRLYGNDRFEVWDYSQSNVETLSSEYEIEAKLVPLKHERTMTGTPSIDGTVFDIDVLFYGTVTPYRRGIINQLRRSGFEVTVVTDSTWGLYFSALDDVISRSSIVLVLNAFGGEGEWKITRLSKLLEMGKFILCERNAVEEEGAYSGDEPGIIFAEKEDMVEVLKEWWEKGDQERRKVGEKGKEVYEAQGGMGEVLRSALGL